MVYGTLMEALRVREKLNATAEQKPIFLYNRVRYGNTWDFYTKVNWQSSTEEMTL